MELYVTLAVFVLTIAGLRWFQSTPAVVFAVALLVLYTGNIVDTQQLLDSGANQGLLTLILLMLCSLALEKTRFLRVIASKVISSSYRSTWLRLYGLTAVSSAFLNNTAIVSTMLAPIRNNPHHAASRLLIPLSYAAILGGTLTLVGTSTNLIVNSLVIDAGYPSLGFFDFFPIGASVTAVCGVALFFSSRLLPEYKNDTVSAEQYFIDAKVRSGSKMIGKTIEQNGLRHLESLFLTEILRGGKLLSPVSPKEVLQPDDRLIFSGDIKKVMQLNQFDGLVMFAHKNGLPLDNLTEVVVRANSSMVGKTLKSSGFRALFDAAVVAVRRQGEQVSGKLGEVVIKPGDYLVLTVGEDFKTRKNVAKNFIVISGVEPDNTLSGHREWLVLFGFFAAIGLAACSVVSLFKSMFILLSLFLITRCLSVSELVRRLPKEIWLIIASALLLSKALSEHGLADVLDVLVNHSTGLAPLVGLISIYIMTWLLTELVTNNAAAALIFPIAFNLAESLSVNPAAYIFAVAFGASASFISPYGYQTNLMVFNTGQYRIMDFIKVGLPISICYGLTVISAIGKRSPVGT
jgi:di/tricarboxylate transporter